jgi:hypothetical protein
MAHQVRAVVARGGPVGLEEKAFQRIPGGGLCSVAVL